MELPGQIFVKQMDGKTITLDNVKGSDTIEDIKYRILEKQKINDDPFYLKIMFPPGYTNDENKTMDEIGVKKESTLHIIYKIGPPREKKYSVKDNSFNDKIENLIMRIVSADPDEKSVVVIPGSVLGSDSQLKEELVMSDSEYYYKHDLFRQQLPLPILQEAYNSNKNVHIFLIDPEFNLSVNAIDDVRNIYDKIDANNSMIFSEESSDSIDKEIGFYLEETYEIFKEIKLKNIDIKKEDLYVYVYVLPFTIKKDEINRLKQMLENKEHYIYLHASAAASSRLTNEEITTNSNITRRLKYWHDSNFTKVLTQEGKGWVKSAIKDMKKRQKGGKTPKHYTTGLSRKDKKKQQRYLKKSSKDYDKGKYTTRPKLKSFKSKKSNWTTKFKKKYGEDVKTYSQISKATGIPSGALKAVVKKGMGAYYSSGSRPNQTAESWGKARMYSYIMGGPTRKIDHHITEEYNVKF